jgi:hypothetical protein
MAVFAPFEEARRRNRAQFNHDCMRALRWYYGLNVTDENDVSYCTMKPNESPATYQFRQDKYLPVNIVRLIVDKLFTEPYRSMPLRTQQLYRGGELVTETGEDGEQIDTRLSEFDIVDNLYTSQVFNSQMRDNNRGKGLLGEMWAYPFWDEKKKCLVVSWFTPDQVSVEQSKDNPFEFTKAYVQYQNIQDQNGMNAKVKGIEFTAESIAYYEGGSKGKSEPNVIGVMPIVQCRYKTPLGMGEFHGIGLMDELLYANEKINDLLTHINIAVYMNSVGIPLALNVPKEVLDSGFSWFSGLNLEQLSTDSPVPDFRFVTPGSNLEGAIRWLETYVAAVFNSFGLYNSSPLQLNLSAPESGIAKWLREADIRESQMEQRPDLYAFETTLYDRMLRTASHAINNGRIDPDVLAGNCYLTVDFGDPRPAMTITEQMSVDKEQMLLGIKNEVDIMLEHNPDLQNDRSAAFDEVVKRLVEAEKLKYETSLQTAQYRREKAQEMNPGGIPKNNRFME